MTQEQIQRIVDECGNSLPGGYESIPIPDSSTWMFTMMHIGVDTSDYKEANIRCLTWKDAQGVLLSSAVSLTPQSASAYEKSQATSQTSECGNEFMPTNIGCQDTESQIQGDEKISNFR